MKARIIFMSAALLALVSFVTPQVQAETISISTSATLVKAYSMNKVRDLSFGTIIPVAAGDKITITANEDAADQYGAGVIAAAGALDVTAGDHTDAVIEITTGINAMVLTVGGVPSTTLTDGAGNTLTINNRNTNLAVATKGFNALAATAGTYYLHIGGDLIIPANAPAGNYAGTMDVTLTF